MLYASYGLIRASVRVMMEAAPEGHRPGRRSGARSPPSRAWPRSTICTSGRSPRASQRSPLTSWSTPATTATRCAGRCPAAQGAASGWPTRRFRWSTPAPSSPRCRSRSPRREPRPGRRHDRHHRGPRRGQFPGPPGPQDHLAELVARGRAADQRRGHDRARLRRAHRPLRGRRANDSTRRVSRSTGSTITVTGRSGGRRGRITVAAAVRISTS